MYNPYAAATGAAGGSSHHRRMSTTITTATSSTSGSTEARLRQLLRSSLSSSSSSRNGVGLSSLSPPPPPPTSEILAVEEQLRQRRDVVWTELTTTTDRSSKELAIGVGGMVVRHLGPCCETMTTTKRSSSNNDNDHCPSMPFPDFPEGTSALLILLVTAMEDWNDHIMYAVLMHSGSDEHDDETQGFTTTTTRTCTGSHPHPRCLLDVLSRLVRYSNELKSTHNNHDHAAGDMDDNRRQRQDRQYFQDPVQRNATLALASAWRSLHRMQQETQLVGSHPVYNDAVPWWIDLKVAEYLAHLSMNLLWEAFLLQDNTDDHSSLRWHDLQAETDQWRMAALTIVGTLLEHGLVDLSGGTICENDDKVFSDIVSKLIKGIQILNHPVLPPSASEYTLPVALASMSVLSLLKHALQEEAAFGLFHGLNQTIQSTRLVDNIVQFTFFLSDTSRWIHPSALRFPKGYTQSFGLHLMSCWKLFDTSAWNVVVALDSRLVQAVDAFWTCVTGNEYSAEKLESYLPSILWLHQHRRLESRDRLLSVLERVTKSGGRSIQSTTSLLFNHFFGLLRKANVSEVPRGSQLLLCRLLRELFSDRRTVATHDELSRLLWQAIDKTTVEGHMTSVLEHATTEDENQPLLLSLLDLLGTLLEHEDCCNHLMDNLGAHKLESLLYLIKPRDVRYDFLQTDDGHNMESETPPLHNLSKMDETSICMEVEDVKDPKGIDHAVRLATALAAANLAYGSSLVVPDEGIGLLVSRISSAVNDFVDGYSKAIEEGGDPSAYSMDSSRRFFRLQRAISIPENEDFLVSMMSTSGVIRKKKVAEMKSRQTTLEAELEVSRRREREAREANASTTRQLQSQAVVFRREMNRVKVNLAQDSRQLVSMHASERSAAESRMHTLAQQSEQIKSDLDQALAKEHILRDEVNQARAAREAMVAEAEELGRTNNSLQRAVQDEKDNAANLVQEVEDTRNRIQSIDAKYTEMRQTLSERNRAVSEAHATTDRLQDNLEDLFADMCNLAQILDHNEGQISAERQKRVAATEQAEQKLRVERERNKELDATVEALQKDNDKLKRKLGKYRERLEQEIKSRRDEEEHRRKRNGPVSYINSLHTSTLSDKNTSRDQRSQAAASSSHSRSSRDLQNRSSSHRLQPPSRAPGKSSTTDKENRAWTQRRTQY